MADKNSSQGYLKSLVREDDMDRYLAVLLCPRQHKTSLLALAALNVELGRIQHAVSDPTLAAMRFQYWRDVFKGGGSGAGNPTADAVINTIERYNLPDDRIGALIDGHENLYNAAPDNDDLNILAVDAPLFELMALVTGGVWGEELTSAAGCAARAMAAAKIRGHEGLARLNARECAGYLENLPASIFGVFLPVSLVDFYLNGDPESPNRQLKRMWCLWRAQRKRNLLLNI